MFELRDIEAGYGETTVLRGVSLVVPASSVVALLGANGAGKTTLLRVASGLLRPSAGAVLIDGDDVTEASPHHLASLGVCHVPEGRGIFPSLTVRDNLRLQSLPGEEDEAVERATDTFDALSRRIDQPAGNLSGGEQQILAMARSYVRNPRFVLLDEVSMGLAPKIVDEIFEYLTRLAAEGASLLLVEQYVTRALDLADFVFLLNRGEIAFAGEPGELDEGEVLATYLGAEAVAASAM